jgi:hypothetical protein
MKKAQIYAEIAEVTEKNGAECQRENRNII